MTTRQPVHVWPPTAPTNLDGLYEQIASLLPDHDIVVIDRLADLGRKDPAGDPGAAVVVLDATTTQATSFPAELQAAITHLKAAPELDIVFVLGDGFLGTDTGDLSASMVGASAVSAVRSLALLKGRPGRSNVVCVPDEVLGGGGTQKGPLSQPTEMIDVADAISYLLGETGDYVSGQTLYVNGGRHLFSSQTA